MVTASFDKTARVWSLPDGQLQTILRIPTGEGNFGYLYAVAITPDGNTLAVSGWTTRAGDAANIYLFDRVSGTLKQRLSEQSAVVLHLAYSKDGHYLVATLGNKKGIRVFDVARLVTTSSDGFVRLYAAGHYDQPTVQVRPQKGEQPFSIAFSPDEKRVAVGFYGTANVMVLSAANL